MEEDWKKAFLIVWQIVSIAILGMFLLLIIFNKDIILESIPTCSYKLQGKECILCGSTRAFYQIKEMNFQKAYQLNKLSVIFFLTFVLNSVFFISYWIQKNKLQKIKI